MKYIVYINDNTPGAERRPTFKDDLDSDLREEQIEAVNDEEAYKNAYLILSGYSPEDEEEFLDAWGFDGDMLSYKDMIENADWSDGGPFIYRIEDEQGNAIYKGCSKEDFYDDCEDCDDEYDEDEEDEYDEDAEDDLDPDTAYEMLDQLDLDDDAYEYYRQCLDELTYDDKSAQKNGHGAQSYRDVIDMAQEQSSRDDYDESDKDEIDED